MSKKNRKIKKPVVYFDIDEELKKFNYQPLSTLQCGDHAFVKVVNENGQKVYILIDEPLTLNTNLQLTLSADSFTDYSQKSKVLKIAELECHGLILECHEGLCYLYHTVEDQADNLIVKESNYLLEEKVETDQLCYPVVKLSEVKHDNALVVSGCNNIIRHLRNDTYTTCYKQLLELQENCKILNEDVGELIKLINLNTNKVKSIDDLVSKNQKIDQLICGMQKLTLLNRQIEQVDYEVNDYIDHLIK